MSYILLLYAGITLLLALSVYQMIVNEKLPATSDAVPLLGNQLLGYATRCCPVILVIV